MSTPDDEIHPMWRKCLLERMDKREFAGLLTGRVTPEELLERHFGVDMGGSADE